MCVGTSSFKRVRLASTVHLAVNPKFGLHCTARIRGVSRLGKDSVLLGKLFCFHASPVSAFGEFIRSYSFDGSQSVLRTTSQIYVTEI